ncbi:metal-dependent hydrolase [Haladaptatus caseinilyticus]|uniref:metal-dependent hydrolase n=1 Tax=Haladaptatus caseinilyticus TaxID=2993314 RepID=UPI00224B0DAF|nr:metal-dependent hydrolase [Haladaptatus caseinilyticus]
MWPWGHLAVGYIAYSGFRRTWSARPPTDYEVFALALGTQFPDIIDKPLAWGFGVLPTGRSLAHSLLTASLLLAITYGYCRRRGIRNFWAAFAIGYLTHPFADVFQPVLLGQYQYAVFLLWPIRSFPTNHPVYVSPFDASGFFAFELLLVAVALIVWLFDGTPGLDVVTASTNTRK